MASQQGQSVSALLKWNATSSSTTRVAAQVCSGVDQKSMNHLRWERMRTRATLDYSRPSPTAHSKSKLVPVWRYPPRWRVGEECIVRSATMNGENQRIRYRLSRSAVEALPSQPGCDRFVAALVLKAHCATLQPSLRSCQSRNGDAGERPGDSGLLGRVLKQS